MMMFGKPVTISEHATALPKLREPHTDDMRAMVDVLLVRCPPSREPACFEIAGAFVMHPALADRLVRQMPTPPASRTKPETNPIFVSFWPLSPFKPVDWSVGGLL
jgi:hypothetical protein